mmetsp:Transcript_6000/g.25170  ORF Transcript_6000/g.25170 Transcript_6000/m.25170 type:complete len:310 (+) Transcript_6000:396-1325(+)
MTAEFAPGEPRARLPTQPRTAMASASAPGCPAQLRARRPVFPRCLRRRSLRHQATTRRTWWSLWLSCSVCLRWWWGAHAALRRAPCLYGSSRRNRRSRRPRWCRFAAGWQTISWSSFQPSLSTRRTARASRPATQSALSAWRSSARGSSSCGCRATTSSPTTWGCSTSAPRRSAPSAAGTLRPGRTSWRPQTGRERRERRQAQARSARLPWQGRLRAPLPHTAPQLEQAPRATHGPCASPARLAPHPPRRRRLRGGTQFALPRRLGAECRHHRSKGKPAMTTQGRTRARFSSRTQSVALAPLPCRQAEA